MVRVLVRAGLRSDAARRPAQPRRDACASRGWERPTPAGGATGLARRGSAVALRSLVVALVLVGTSGQAAVIPLGDIPVSATTGEKPQSKLWFHAGTWWAVLPSTSVVPSGTWLWRLEANQSWTNVLRIAASTSTQADAKLVGDVTHILLHAGASQLVSVEYVPAANTYALWATRPTATSIPLAGSETATIDIDSGGRMWLATEAGPQILVYYSDVPYAAFSGPVVLASNVTEDDISVVTALPDATIGVLWSNQNTQRFGFKRHQDGADPSVWSADEVPAGSSALNVGAGQADDHLHVAVATDGTLYAAVKTSYDTAGFPKIALLVRRPNVVLPGDPWDPLYEVDQAGTRGIVLLNEATARVRVVYTSSEGFNDLVFKETALSPISFGPRQTLITGGVNDATSTKQNWTDQVVVLASNSTTARGVLITEGTVTTTTITSSSTTTTTLLFEPLVGHWPMEEGSGTQILDVSGNANHGALSGTFGWMPTADGQALTLGGANGSLATVPDSASLDVTEAITIAAWVRPGRATTTDLVAKDVNGSVDGYQLSLSASTAANPQRVFARFNQATSGDTFRVNSSAMYPADGLTWMHVAVTYDRVAHGGDGLMRLYINGVFDTSVTGPVGGIVANTTSVGIGGQASDGTRTLLGALDDVRIYNQALTAGEIAALAAVSPTTTTSTSSSSTSTTTVPTSTSTSSSTSTSTSTSTSSSTSTSTSTSTSSTTTASTTVTTSSTTTSTTTSTSTSSSTSTSTSTSSTTTLPAVTVNIRTTKMTLVDGSVQGTTARRRLVFRSSTKTDAAPNRIVLPLVGTADDPTLHGATLRVYNAAGGMDDVSVTLQSGPAGTWTVNTSGTVFKWKGLDRNGPVRRITVKADRLSITAGKSNWGYTLDEAAQGSVALRLQLGSGATWCAQGGQPGFLPRKDIADRFIATPRTPPPPLCP
jgi:hypothetical protein